jgi:hypothetical protein
MSKEKKRTNRLIKRIAKRLAGYSAAAAVTVAASHGTANAAMITHDIADVTVGAEPGLLFNVITGATTDATASAGNSITGSFRIASYLSAAPYIAGPASSILAGFVGPGGFAAGVDVDASNLNAASAVSVGKNFAANIKYLSYGNYAYLAANFTNNKGFVGLQFDIAGSLHHGWAEVTYLGTGNGIMLHSFGYDNTPVPEPTSMLLLGAGAAGLALWRKRKPGKTA